MNKAMQQQRRRRTMRTASPVRRGSVLYIVLIVIALLTLAAYQFTEIMIAESSATDVYGRRVRVRAIADSGIEVAAMALQNRQLLTSDNVADVNLYHNPQRYAAILIQGTDNGPPRSRGRYSIVAPVENDDTGRSIRFGLADESGKLNLNIVSKIAGNDEEGQEAARYMLLAIPGMTPQTADAILDWIDADDDERLNGAEKGYRADYSPKNGPLESLDELLLINGITPTMVFGYDSNRNGRIDPNEAKNAAANPELHPLGWSAYLTVHSKEWNRKADGTEKINVNDGVLTELYDKLADAFTEHGNGEEVAKFIVAYRMSGASNTSEENQPASQGLSSNNSSNGTGGRSAPSVGGVQLSQQGLQNLAQGVAKTMFKAGGNAQEAVTRGGMDLSGGAKVQINSLYDLVDAEVQVQVNGASSKLTSPWTSDNIARDMPLLMDMLTTVTNKYIEGRVNVNQARKEVLLGVISSVEGFKEDPNLAADLAQKIVNRKMIDSTGAPVNDDLVRRASTAWLVTEGFVTLQQMRQLDRLLTTRGDVYRAQVVGFYDQGGPMVRLETIIDATQSPPRVVFLRDLTELGKGFTPQELGAPTQ